MSGRRDKPAPVDTSPERLRALQGDELDALYAEFHTRVFACYDEIEQVPERRREAALARAQQRAAPLIEQARAVHDERVRRLRRKARRWWIATALVAVAGSAAIAWLLMR